MIKMIEKNMSSTDTIKFYYLKFSISFIEISDKYASVSVINLTDSSMKRRLRVKIDILSHFPSSHLSTLSFSKSSFKLHFSCQLFNSLSYLCYMYAGNLLKTDTLSTPTTAVLWNHLRWSSRIFRKD